MSTKICSACGGQKTLADFYRTVGSHASSTGYHAKCKTCCKEWQEKYRLGSKTQRSASHKKYREQNRASVLISLAKHRAKKAGLHFDLDQFSKQIQKRIDNGRCELSGMPFRLDGGRTWDSPSLDRITPALGYVVSNVRVVLFSLNVMMNTWGVEPVLAIADQIKQKRKDAEEHPLAKWEARLKERLANLGSTEFALIWNQKVTPSGRSISQLQQSTLHKNGPGTGGSQWPTARTSDANGSGAHGDGGLDLRTTMELAQWPAPTVADVEGGRKTRSGVRSGEMLLNGLMAQWCAPSARDWKDSAGMSTTGINPDGTERQRIDMLPRQMIHFGPTPTGSTAPTGKRGAPNPVFACWLMGWPDELTYGALQAIQLFHGSRRKSSRRSSK